MVAKNRRQQKDFGTSSVPLFGDIQIPEANEDILNTHLLQELEIDDLYQVQFIKTSLITESKDNNYPVEHIEELAESIAKFMLLSPINVRKTGDENYEIVSGHRRKLAFELLYEIHLATSNKDKLDSIASRFELAKKSHIFNNLVEIVTKNRNRFEGFNCIPAFVFPSTMTDDEINRVLDEANLLARHLTIADGMQHINYFINDLDYKQMPISDITTYIQDKFASLGFDDWKSTKINEYVTVDINGTEELKHALKNGEISTKNARFVSTFDPNMQRDILERYKNDSTIIDELKLEKKKNAKYAKAKSTPLSLNDLKKNVIHINKYAESLKGYTEPIIIKKSDKHNVSEIKSMLLDTKRNLFDTLSSIELMLKSVDDE